MTVSLKKTLRALAAASYSAGGVCLAVALALSTGIHPAFAGFDLDCPDSGPGPTVSIGFQAPDYAGTQIDIDWGDGSETYFPTAKEGAISHTYTASGEYRIEAVLRHGNVEEGNDGAQASCDATVVIVVPTEVPPTEVPPTEVPPTEVPPTEVPPTEVPPTSVPPTAVPPASAPPADNPPAQTVVQPTPEPVLIPVTGVSLAGQRAWMPRWFFNLGLAFVGVGMVLHGLSFKVKREE